MSPDISALKAIAPPLRRSIFVTASALLVGLAIILFGILPVRKRLRIVKAEIAQLTIRAGNMGKDIAGTAKQRDRTQALETECHDLFDSGVIEPLLGSFAMRGKALLDPLAQETGFTINSVKEDHFIPLRLPKPAPNQLYGRQLVEFTGYGAYTQIVAFVSSAEKTLPLACLSGFRIESQQQTPESHKAVITFEWPVKGEAR